MSGLHPLLSVRPRVLDQFHHRTHGGSISLPHHQVLTGLDVPDCSRPDVAAGDPPPGPGQRLQQCPSQRPLLRSLQTQRYRRLPDDLHLHGLQRHRGVRLHPRHPHPEA